MAIFRFKIVCNSMVVADKINSNNIFNNMYLEVMAVDKIITINKRINSRYNSNNNRQHVSRETMMVEIMSR